MMAYLRQVIAPLFSFRSEALASSRAVPGRAVRWRARGYQRLNSTRRFTSNKPPPKGSHQVWGHGWVVDLYPIAGESAKKEQKSNEGKSQGNE